MSKRVVICGIDTGTLPKLNHEQTMALLKKAQNGDENAKNDFVMANMRLVLSDSTQRKSPSTTSFRWVA